MTGTRDKTTLALGVVLILLGSLLTFSGPAKVEAQGSFSKTNIYDAYANYTVTVSTTVLGFPAATLTPNATTTPRRAYCTVDSTNNVRYTYDGTSPTASVGHRGAAGTNFEVYGSGNMSRLRFIREGGADSAVSCTLER